MYVVELTTTDPHYNLAAEEFFLKQKSEDYFILWRNERSVIVGRNQNTYAEIDINYAEQNGISVVRRLTGGGAVFHDLGNVNYTFIEGGAEDKFGNYETFSQPVIEAIRSLGVDACLKGRNDLCIGDRKFSGNAQTLWHGRMLHHGTLLFSADFSSLTNVLKVDPDKIKSKGIKSVRSRVTNINEHLSGEMDVEDFMKLLLEFALAKEGSVLYTLTDEDEKAIDALYREKYSKREWNYGFNKEFSIKNKGVFEKGIITVCLDVDDNKIKNISFFGDFFGTKEVAELEQILVGSLYDRENIKSLLKQAQIESYFSDISPDELLTIMF